MIIKGTAETVMLHKSQDIGADRNLLNTTRLEILDVGVPSLDLRHRARVSFTVLKWNPGNNLFADPASAGSSLPAVMS